MTIIKPLFNLFHLNLFLKIMDKQLGTRLNFQSNHWLDLAETASVIGSIGGSVASLFFKEIFLASIPLSVCVALNLVNRQRLLNLTTAENKKALAELAQQNQDNYTDIPEQLTQLQQSTNHQLTKYQTAQKTLSQQLTQLNTDLNKRTQELEEQYNQIAVKIDNLSQISSSTQTIQASTPSAKLYCQWGNSYQQLGNQERAIEDYTKAIEIDSRCALAYHNRGLVNSDLGNKKAAVEDLRKAAKFYFEQGDLDNYQKTKNMSQALHELNSASQEQDPNQVLASSLFS